MTRSAVRNTSPAICSAGKTIFLKFLLVRLISAHQVVLLCDSGDAWLFYNGRVYLQLVRSGFKNLPRYKPSSYRPVWTLVDVDFKITEPPVKNSNVWPIQSSPPDSIRWKSWVISVVLLC